MAKILVVDDEKNIRELYRAELVDDGHEVEVAGSGDEGLAKVESFGPDLVTLDVKMPGLDGIAVLTKLKGRSPSPMVVLLTAYGEFKQDFTTWAADAYVVKSSDTSEVRRVVKELLAKK